MVLPPNEGMSFRRPELSFDSPDSLILSCLNRRLVSHFCDPMALALDGRQISDYRPFCRLCIGTGWRFERVCHRPRFQCLLLRSNDLQNRERGQFSSLETFASSGWQHIQGVQMWVLRHLSTLCSRCKDPCRSRK